MILTYKYRIKDRTAKKALRRHAIAVNQVWNYCVAQHRDVRVRYNSGSTPRKWASAFDLCKLTAGCSAELGILADTINGICLQFATARDRLRREPRFRASFGRRRALGWVPFPKARDRCVEGNSVSYMKRRYRFWEGGRPVPESAKGGCFVEDARGRWYVCFQVEVAAGATVVSGEVGVDLGLRSLAVTSKGEAIENPRHFRRYELALAVAQRAGNKRRAATIHNKIKNARRDHLHKVSAKLVRENSLIVVGDVSPSRLKKTSMAKSIGDAGWSEFRTLLAYKASRHGVRFVVVSERLTTQTCSCCGSIPDSSPKGMGALGIRAWDCSECGASHDRDVNAAKNILKFGRSAPPHADESRRIAA